MFEIYVYINNIDYIGSLNACRNIFKKHHIPVDVGQTVLMLMPNVAKQKLLVTFANRYKTNILDAIRRFVSKYDIKLAFNDMQIKGVQNMMEIKMVVDDVDYESIIRFVLPMVSEKLNNSKELFFLNKLLDDEQAAGEVVSAVLNAVPEKMKKDMISSAVEGCGDRISNALNKLLADKEIRADITKISVK